MHLLPRLPAPADNAGMRIQFRLRTLFFIVTLLAILCSIVVKLRTQHEKQADEQQRIKKQVDKGGGFRPIAIVVAGLLTVLLWPVS
ncbi:MAG TPA: hypothetical protein VGH32_04175 [Pirellulales bacterium]